MKKSIFALAMAFGVTSAFAQDLTSKKGEPFLPETDDWSIGVDATPFLDYVGNFFGKTGPNAAPTWQNYGANQTIVGKMFKDEKTAYRATLRLGRTSQTWKNEIVAPVASTTPGTFFPTATNGMVEDKAKASSGFIGLGVGIEKRRGKTRLQGIYGAEIFIWYTSQKNKITYGNALTQGATDPNIDPSANSTNYAGQGINNLNGLTGYNATDSRLLTRKFGKELGIGVRAFIGAEYFIIPKLSLAGEFGWGIGFAKTLKEKQTWEAEGPNSVGIETPATIEKEVIGGSRMVIDTDRNAAASSSYNFSPNGTIRMNFHF